MCTGSSTSVLIKISTVDYLVAQILINISKCAGRIATGKGAAEARYGKAKQEKRRQAKGRCVFGNFHTTECN